MQRTRNLIERVARWFKALREPRVYTTYRPLSEWQHKRRELDNARKMQAAQEEFRRGPKPTPPTKD